MPTESKVDVPGALVAAAGVSQWSGALNAGLGVVSTAFSLYDQLGPQRRFEKKLRKLQLKLATAQLNKLIAEATLYVTLDTTAGRLNVALMESADVESANPQGKLIVHLLSS